MASLNLHSPQSLSLSSKPSSLSPQIQSSSLSFRFRTFKNKTLFSIRSSSNEASLATRGFAPAIALTENALKQLNAMRIEKDGDLYVRIGVKQGRCSGLSYTKKFVIICDPESLVVLRGVQLDYVDSLVGGGFSFKNTNAMPQTCNCAKTFCCRSVNVESLHD